MTERCTRVPLFLSGVERPPRGRDSRASSTGSSEEAAVRIQAWDDSGARRRPITLTVAAGAVAHFNSTDLETGNLSKGLSGGVGSGQGHWRLELSSAARLDILAYVRTADGFVASMHGKVAPAPSGSYEIPTFNPASNRDQASLLRILNPGVWDARGRDHGRRQRGQPQRQTSPRRFPPEVSLTLSAQELESGGGVTGRLGDGTGKWRLTVTPQRPVQVMAPAGEPERAPDEPVGGTRSAPVKDGLAGYRSELRCLVRRTGPGSQAPRDLPRARL